jgi:8-oxo-dGTP diphosphatase
MPASDQGSFTGRYSLIPRTLIFLTSEEYVLLLKGAPHKRLWANRYNGIGGHVERGENVFSAAHRELHEEAGVTVENLRLCGVVTIDTEPTMGICLFVLRAECPRLEVIASKEGTPEWVHRHELHHLPLVEDLHQLLPRLLSMQPGDPPFSAHYWYDSDGALHTTFS